MNYYFLTLGGGAEKCVHITHTSEESESLVLLEFTCININKNKNKKEMLRSKLPDSATLLASSSGQKNKQANCPSPHHHVEWCAYIF